MPWLIWVFWIWQAPPPPVLPAVPIIPGLETFGLLASVLGWLMWRHDMAVNKLAAEVQRNTRATAVMLLMYHQAEAAYQEVHRQLKAILAEMPSSGTNASGS